MYRYYQKVGGEESWTPIQADLDLASVKPTFVTVLDVDTLVRKDMTRQELDAIKYLGPMYFDIDSSDISEAINSAQLLVAKLGEAGVQDTDFDIFLSGKKGLHILIPPTVFMAKVAPVARLPAIYKEIAFNYAVPALDYKVYTARSGRMLRTCFNVRENGNYRVPITADELRSLTEETYQALCKTPRIVAAAAPQFRAQFALTYDSFFQKISKLKPAKSKQATPAELQRSQPDVQKVLEGNVNPDAGFNKIALQIALYARDSGWTSADLVKKAEKLLENHQSDGSRYNSPARRAVELQRMMDYLEDNPAYNFAASGIRAILATAKKAVTEEGEETPAEEAQEDYVEFSAGVSVAGNAYVVTKEDGDVAISNFVFREPEAVRDIESGLLLSIKAKLRNSNTPIFIPPASCTGSSSLQNLVSPYGCSFTGSDAHARGVFQLMLKEITKSSYLIDSEGVNLVKMPNHPDPEVAAGPFMVWADRYGVLLPDRFKGRVDMMFQGWPEETGVLKTDLAMAEHLDTWVKSKDNQTALISLFKSFLDCNTTEAVAKLLGWMVASHWKPLFQHTYGKFPMLHVFGPAGLGKTETTFTLMKMFYNAEEVKATTPTSTPFAFLQLVAGSSSIPIALDEWKPHRMVPAVMEQYKALLRDSYNGKTTQRGGGNRAKESFGALNKVTLSAPIVYISEAAEMETALVERSVMLPMRRVGARELAYSLQNFLRFQSLSHILPIVGRAFAAKSLETTAEAFKEEFNKLHAWASENFLPSPKDAEDLAAGLITQEELRLKGLNRPRIVFNNTVVLFGLVKFRELIEKHAPEAYQTMFKPRLQQAVDSVYVQHGQILEAAVPEYVKVLSTFSYLSTTGGYDDGPALIEGVDYNISDLGGLPVLVMVVRNCYNKYRKHCRDVGEAPLYPSELSFDMAIADTPFYIRRGTGTAKSNVETAIFDLEDMMRSGVTRFAGRPVQLNL